MTTAATRLAATGRAEPARVLVVIPALNEGAVIEELVTAVRAALPEADVLVVDDGSTDETAARARRVEGVRVLSLPVNLGIGGAVQAGLLYAERGGYDAAIQVDGDGQHEPTSARALLAVVLGGAADLCIGSRFLGDKSYPVPFARRTGIRYFSTLVRFLVGERASDPTSGFRAYGRRAIRAFAESYPADYPEPVSIISAARAGLVLAERPCRMHPRRHGQSSITPLRSLFYVVNVSLAMLIARSRRG